MSPELEGRLKEQQAAEELSQQATPVSVILTLPLIVDGSRKKFSGTLDRVVIGSGVIKVTMLMLIDEAVHLISALHDSIDTVERIEIMSDTKEIELCHNPVRVQKSILKDIDHLTGVCRVFIDIA